MAREEMAKQGSDRRRSRAGLNLNVNFNGGVVLLLGAAAGALLASAFASHRIRAHKRRRGLMKEGIQEDSSEHLASHGAKEFVGDEGGERDGEGVSQVIVRKKSVHISLPKKQEIWFKICYFQVNSHDNLDARVQISQVDRREIEFCLLEEGKGEVAERNSTIDTELVDGERGELAGLRESGANISSSPRNTCHNLGEKQLMYDDQELVASSVKEEYKTSFVNCKEDDDEDNKKAYIEEWDQKEEIYEKMNSSDLHSEQPILLENCTHEHPAMIIAVEEKTLLEENRTCNLNDGFQEEKAEENLLNGFKENVESFEAEENHKENEECPLTESQRIELALEQDDLMAYKESPLIQFQEIEPIVREEKACLDDRFPISIESNMKVVQAIQDNNLNNSEKTLGIEESHMEAGAKGSETSPNEEVEEREDEAISVQYHELETRQHIAAHKGEIECPQILPVVKNAEAEIHKESKARIKEKEDEEEKNLKVSFDLVEKGVKTVAKTVKQDTKTGLIDVDDKHQRQVDGHENTVSSKGKQQRIATKKVKGTEYMFMGYTKCHIFLLTTLAAAIAVLAFLYTKAFLTRTAILENFITS